MYYVVVSQRISVFEQWDGKIVIRSLQNWLNVASLKKTFTVVGYISLHFYSFKCTFVKDKKAQSLMARMNTFREVTPFRFHDFKQSFHHETLVLTRKKCYLKYIRNQYNILAVYLRTIGIVILNSSTEWIRSPCILSIAV